jgi:hypothetical protein
MQPLMHPIDETSTLLPTSNKRVEIVKKTSTWSKVILLVVLLGAASIGYISGARGSTGHELLLPRSESGSKNSKVTKETESLVTEVKEPECVDLFGPSNMPWSDFISCEDEKNQGACSSNATVQEGCLVTCGICLPVGGPPVEEPVVVVQTPVKEPVVIVQTPVEEPVVVVQTPVEEPVVVVQTPVEEPVVVVEVQLNPIDNPSVDNDNNGSGVMDGSLADGASCEFNTGCASGNCDDVTKLCSVCNNLWDAKKNDDASNVPWSDFESCEAEAGSNAANCAGDILQNCQRACLECGGNTAPLDSICWDSTQCDSSYCNHETGKCAVNPENAVTNLADGNSCTLATECSSLFCHNGKCETIAPIVIPILNGAQCATSDECASGYCSEGMKCEMMPVVYGDEGQACTKNKDCSIDQVCFEKICADKEDQLEAAEGAECVDLFGPLNMPWSDFISCADEKNHGACANELILQGCRATCGVCVPIGGASQAVQIANVEIISEAPKVPEFVPLGPGEAPGQDRGIPPSYDFSEVPFKADSVVSTKDGDRACGRAAEDCVILDPKVYFFGGGKCSSDNDCGKSGYCGAELMGDNWMPAKQCLCYQGWTGENCEVPPPLSDLPSYVVDGDEQGRKFADREKSGEVSWIKETTACAFSNAMEFSDDKYYPKKWIMHPFCPSYGLKSRIRYVNDRHFREGDCYDFYTPENGCVVGQALPQRSYHIDGSLAYIEDNYKRATCADEDLAFHNQGCRFDESQSEDCGDYGYFDSRFGLYKPFASNLGESVEAGCIIEFYAGGLPKSVVCKPSPSSRSSKYAGGASSPDQCNGYRYSGSDCNLGYRRYWQEEDFAKMSFVQEFLDATNVKNLKQENGPWYVDQGKIAFPIQDSNGVQTTYSIGRDLIPHDGTLDKVVDYTNGNTLRDKKFKVGLLVGTPSNVPANTAPSSDYFKALFKNAGEVISEMSGGLISFEEVEPIYYQPTEAIATIDASIDLYGVKDLGGPYSASTLETYLEDDAGHIGKLDSDKKCYRTKSQSELFQGDEAVGGANVVHWYPEYFYELMYKDCSAQKPCTNFWDEDKTAALDYADGYDEFESCDQFCTSDYCSWEHTGCADNCYKTCSAYADPLGQACPKSDGCTEYTEDECSELGYAVGIPTCNSEFNIVEYNPDVPNWTEVRETFDITYAIATTYTCIGGASYNKNVIHVADDHSAYKSIVSMTPSTLCRTPLY